MKATSAPIAAGISTGKDVVNVFDPWARDRGSYYSLEWKPRAGAEADPAFKKP